MKNIRNLVLTIVLTIATLSDMVTCAAPFPFALQTGKMLFKYAALPITCNVTFNGLLGNTVIQETIKNYKTSCLTISVILFALSAPIHIISLVAAPESPRPHIPTTIIGGLGMATSYAAMRYCDNQIKARLPSNNLNREKKENEPTR